MPVRNTLGRLRLCRSERPAPQVEKYIILLRFLNRLFFFLSCQGRWKSTLRRQPVAAPRINFIFIYILAGRLRSTSRLRPVIRSAAPRMSTVPSCRTSCPRKRLVRGFSCKLDKMIERKSNLLNTLAIYGKFSCVRICIHDPATNPISHKRHIAQTL